MSAAPPADGRSLAGGAARGAAWNVLTFGLGKGVLLLTTVVLARILRPEDFGLLALALIVVVYLDVLGDIGVGPAIIYRRETDAEGAARASNSGVLLAAATGVALTGLVLLAAPLLARAFEEPRLTGVVRVIALSFLLRMLCVVHRARLEKELQFARRAVPEVVGAVVKAGTSIGLAVAGAGVYSLAWGQVAGAGATTVLYWALVRWRFRPVLDLGTARELLRFGVPVTLLGLLASVTQSLDQLIIGRRLDAAALGQYSIAYRLPELFVLHFCYLMSGALFPAYAKASHDPDQLRHGFRSALRLVSLVTTPVAVGLALVAGDLVPLLFGAQWEPAVPVMRLLAVATLLLALSFNVGDVYKARGRPGVLNWLALLRLALSAPLLWLLAPGGIVAVAAGLVGICAVMTSVQLVVASRLMASPLRGVLREFLPAAGGAAVLAGAVLAAQWLLGSAPPGARLAGAVVAGAVGYLAALLALAPDTVRQVRHLARSALGRVPAPAEPTAGP